MNWDRWTANKELFMRLSSSVAQRPCVAEIVCFLLRIPASNKHSLLQSLCTSLTCIWILQYAFGAKRGLWITLPPQLIVMVSF